MSLKIASVYALPPQGKVQRTTYHLSNTVCIGIVINVVLTCTYQQLLIEIKDGKISFRFKMFLKNSYNGHCSDSGKRLIHD